MPILDDPGRQAIRDLVMRRLGYSITKADLRAAIDATDQWIEDNSAAFNSALPQPARGVLTSDQKTMLFCQVALRRAGL